MKIESKRLVLREMNMEDFDALYEIFSDEKIMKYYPCAFDEIMVRKWIKSNILRYEIFGFGLWSVCLKDTGKVIGDCGITMQRIDGVIKPEIGYHIHKDYQRQGYAKEASCCVRDWIFNKTPFNIIFSYMNPDNIPSQKTAISYGCHQVLECEENVKVYALTREEWVKLKEVE